MVVKLAVILLFAFILLVMGQDKQPDPCEEKICPHFLDPVCGIFETKLISFANQCEFENETCKLRKKGQTVRLGTCPDWHIFAK